MYYTHNLQKSPEVRFLQQGKWCNMFNYVTNQEIIDELGVYTMYDKIQMYREKWRQYIGRI